MDPTGTSPKLALYGVRHALRPAWLLLAIALPAPCRAETPASSPLNPIQIAVNAEKIALIRASLIDLGDPKPVVREQARKWLLSLDRPDLVLIKQVVKQARPIHRGQVAALREIVTHVYLRGDEYLPDLARRGFMGVMFGTEFEVNEPESGGVEVRRRMPGFCAYRYLEDGDVIRAVLGHQVHVVHMPADVIEAVRAYGAGEAVELEVLRDGQLLRVRIVLDPRPKSIGDEASTADFLGRRQSEAEAYWDENFDPLVNDTVG